MNIFSKLHNIYSVILYILYRKTYIIGTKYGKRKRDKKYNLREHFRQ